MNRKTISPSSQKPVDRVPTGKLPAKLAELMEDVLSGDSAANIQPSGADYFNQYCNCLCSFDEDTE